MPDDLAPQRFRVPREDRSLFTIPGLETAHRMIEENRDLFARSSYSLHGRSLNDLRTSARRDAVALAQSFTSSILQANVPDVAADSLVVTGHQPELFHVGVWAKNFATAGAARSASAVPMNLVIDNDTLNHTSLRIPTGTREHLRAEHIHFDIPRPTQPWEEGLIRDRDTLRAFGQLVRDKVRSDWEIDPLIGTTWDAGVRQSAVSNRLCDVLTAVRVHAERAWGQHNLELPMSRLCQSEPFLWFTAHLLMRLPELHAIYNETVADYRQLHRLRNRQQPVPDLVKQDDWLEAPFWIWQRGDSQRGRLFVRRAGSICELRDEKQVVARIPWTDEGSLDAAVQAMSQLPAQGYRLRTRALTTTLFARTCLADVFVHGIGGAKYDAMTDQICERLFGLKPPGFLTVSATLYLPLGGPFDVVESQLREINHTIRDLHYNPDRHLNGKPTNAATLVTQKHSLLQQASELRSSHQLKGKLTHDQHQQLATINRTLQDEIGPIRAGYETRRSQIRARLAANSLIKNREYSFVLYPEDQVRQFLTPLAQVASANP